MKKIHLFTYNNEIYTSALIKQSIAPSGYSLPISGRDAALLKQENLPELQVIEINEKQPWSRDIEEIAERPVKTICLADKISDKMKQELLARGISDVLVSHDPARLTAYIRMLLEDKKASGSGKIIIYENSGPVKNILNNIITRFEYEPLFVDSLSTLFDNLKHPDLQFTLVNLDARGLQINDFIKRSYSRVEMKRIPMIAYRDMSCGIYVNEVISGLHRLTKFILTPEELYSFLVDILFRKDIVPRVDRVNNSISFDDMSCYSCDSLSQIYHSTREKIFTLENIIDEENLAGLLDSVNLISRSIIRIDGLKWLKKDPGKEKVNTCGFGG